MLLDEIKARMFRAMKSGDVLEKEILRVALGEITTEAARPGRKGDDAETQAILRKLIKSNDESLEAVTAPERRAELQRESEILRSFLPRALGEEELVAALAGVADALRAAGNDGQATGIAMKHLKTTGVVADGKAVGAAVKRLRSP
ncbi:MAG TPA: GatB/YqeY domain-containing protein [Polyangiaceae bacterium]|nr:GatB/YqeY domain-containing protein [Polyangiaceae bacterium]